MLTLSALLQWISALRTPLAPDERPRDPAIETAESEADVVAAPADHLGLDIVSAWAGASSMTSAQTAREHVAFAKSIGLKRLDVIVNDHAAWRDPSDFTTYDVGKIETLANAVTAAGMELHLMSWLMPHMRYVDGAARILIPLISRTGALSVVWDCEEPWTQARQALGYETAAGRVAAAFAGVRQGVTGIGYAPTNKLGPICERADYLVPQCYSTSTSGLDPATVVPKFASRWRAVFPGKPLAIGLAAYRQTGISGYTAESALRAAYGGAVADLSARVAIYWSLRQIRSSTAVTKTLRSLLLG